MKKSFVLSIIIAAVSASSALASPSRNYTSVVTNDDGRVTIIAPKFKSGDGENHWLSTTSDLNGACMLFGYPAAVSAGVQFGPYFDIRTIVIDSQGHFSSFLDSVGYNAEVRILSLMCETGATPATSSRLSQPPIQNDDGTFTLMAPKFGSPDSNGPWSPNGNVLWLSTSSDLNGVCKLYGFRRAITAGLQTYPSQDDLTVVIGGDSKFRSFSKQVGYRAVSRISSLICAQ